MKIALVAPSPVPFVIGGAENLWTSWLAALNAFEEVEAELIKLPSPERTFWEIVDSYRQFAELDLLHFDRVISGKYPAWMAAHPDHHLFLLHKLRGLYDTWPTSMSATPPQGFPAIDRLTAMLSRSAGARSALPEIFGALEELRLDAPHLPPSVFALPGALIRQVVHSLDAIGLAPTAMRRYCSISRTVKQRKDYFPQGMEVTVQHPPAPPRPAPQATEKAIEGAIFSVSRLDGPKRLDWVVQAYLMAKLDVPLVIGGDGPQRGRLEALAGAHPKIRLIGRLTDAELAEAYQRALFVVFVPEQEDYGLVALEALQAGRPVLTCADAGGVTELVQHMENGLIAAPSVPDLADGMRRLILEPALRDRLAHRAAESVVHIQWPNFARDFARPAPRITVVNTFSIFPPRNGGQVRMFQLYRQLARRADVRVVNLSDARSTPKTRMLAPGLTEVVVPMTEAHARFEHRLSRDLRASCADMAAMLRPELTPGWLAAIREAVAWADILIACHPYAFPAIRSVCNAPIIYESLNVEVDLKGSIFGHAPEQVEAVARTERDCARQAPLVLCCSDEDAARMQARYDLPKRPATVPNGVDSASYPSLDDSRRDRLRDRLGLRALPVALFVGSLHGPNLDALTALIAIAEACPDILFCVVGSVCEAPGQPKTTPNLKLVGRVTDAELRVWLAAADVGLNPMTTGSGTNLKMLEYAAAGLPILSTPFGARGGILDAERDFIQAELHDFAPALRALLAPEASGRREARARLARDRAAKAGDWDVIAKHMWEAIEDSQRQAYAQ
ncbi:glycosyltransferase family 4 protein [Thiocystis violacea]|uniref:glycosyltransferase family 4 protein n=1 Tax=Thiocystis violacea TaxID=13725 RepID=UPI00190778D6|nr:glycosyltransferase [Thiocystis violacea]MBK1723518.1 hypothetical protein [Thiocystis violacea]